MTTVTLRRLESLRIPGFVQWTDKAHSTLLTMRIDRNDKNERWTWLPAGITLSLTTVPKPHLEFVFGEEQGAYEVYRDGAHQLMLSPQSPLWELSLQELPLAIGRQF